MKKMASYFIPYSKIYKKSDQYEQQKDPVAKLRELQQEDIFCSEITAYLDRRDLPRDARRAKFIVTHSDQYVIKDQLLYHIEIPSGGVAEQIFRVQLYLPESLQSYVTQEIHEELHLAAEKLTQRLRLSYYWLHMHNMVQRVVQNCSVWQADRKIRKKYEAPLKFSHVPHLCNQVWQMDHLGPINTEKGKLRPKYVLVVVDMDSLYV